MCIRDRSTPDEGIAGFLDLPRYSSGYAALHNAISFMPETHMLKPFSDRVMSTYHFMKTMLETMAKDGDKIRAAKNKAITNTKTKKTFDVNWTIDQSKSDKIMFKGYNAKKKPSLISGKPRLYYDHAEPYEKEIDHFNYYKATASVEKPVAYIFPQAYSEIVDRLRWNLSLIHISEPTRPY